MTEWSPYIGSVFGIKVQLHWTFVLLLLFSLIAALIAPAFLYLFIIIVLLFTCVFVHELSHSVTSIRNKIGIKKIILLPIGGASIIDTTEEIDPITEYRIAVVGPLTSILLGLIFGIAVIYTPAGLVKQLLQFLFIINIALGVFNILPGFPLDGGRVLRSYLQRKHSFIDATKMTVKVSNYFVVLFLIGTIVYAAIIPNYSFINREFLVFWDALIAMWLYGGAKAELQNAKIRDYTSDLRVKDAVSRDYVFVKSGTTMEKLYQVVIKKHPHAILVKKGGEILVASKISHQTLLDGQKYKTVDEASTKIPRIDYNASLYKGLELMGQENIGVIAVMRNGKLFGVLDASHVESVVSLHISRRRAQSKNDA